ncbi:MAG: AAA family ATPase [bacterium]|nr:AAA family ATPase [bacterium]
MVDRITLKNIAAYNGQGVVIDNLKQINFFYGSNGSGKTTVSNVIANEDNYSTCRIEWEDNSKLKTVVYNQDFIENTFNQPDLLKGIFTLGEESKGIEEQINKYNNERESINTEILGLNGTLTQETEKETALEDEFKENCWKLKQKHDDIFKEVFTGHRDDKNSFKQRLLNEIENNTSELKTYEELKQLSEKVFKKNLQKITELPLLIYNNLDKMEVHSIWKTKIIGKQDVDIALMIHKLQNHDWVKEGKKYFDQNNGICPFCQEKPSEIFKKQLEDYFDETYINSIQILEKLQKEYLEITEKNILRDIDNLLIMDNEYLIKKKSEIEDKKDIIKEKAKTNKLLIETKAKEPSKPIELTSLIEGLKDFNELIAQINSEIREHNEIMDNQKEESEKLKREVWKFIAHEINDIYENYKKKKEDIKKAIQNLTDKIKAGKAKETNVKQEISNLEKNIKSVKPTIDSINKILESFGFTNFKLEESPDKKGYYKIIRPNGEGAKKTLSEGERSFIIFLYFYHLIKGSNSQDEDITVNKTVVVDDPVSSLDSDVLFIVSTLIKNILKDIRDKKSNIKQIFILTHNVYFHKEVTFISSQDKGKRKDTSYYIVRKNSNVSSVTYSETNPVETYYQLMWDEFKKNNDCISIQNTMRRIIEYYFKILGGMDEKDLINKFEGQDKTICQCLISWLHEGSHSIPDDMFISPPISEDLVKYKDVFKRIFQHTGHIKHYEMMMGNNVEKNGGAS